MHKHQDAIDEYLAKRKDRIQTARENQMLREENALLRGALENILTESAFEDIHRQLERIIEVASQALAGETNGQHQA